MALILGVSGLYHDSAACLVRGAEIVAAAQEERFTRRRHDADLPVRAIGSVIAQAGVTARDLDYVVFYEKPFQKLDRLFDSYLAFAPRGFSSFRHAAPLWLGEKARVPSRLRNALGRDCRAPMVFVSHHESHAASAFFPSPFEEAAILTMDGVGEWTTTAMGIGRGTEVSLTRRLTFPHSLGLLYSAFTYYCGFRVNSGEYKLMGLAAFGKPVFKDLITRHLVDVKPDGSFRLDMRYFNYGAGLTMTSRAFDELFGAPPRQPGSAPTEREADLAASIQAVTEDIVLAMARDLFRDTGLENLVLAGGVALNCVANGRLLREGPFDHVWIQPAAGDAGGALGAALFTAHALLEEPRPPRASDAQRGSFLGPAFSADDIRSTLDAAGARYEWIDDEELYIETAAILAEGKAIGWFQGPMEFGPRALGGRSILADPRPASMQTTLNEKIKYREPFRPFAPSVLRDQASRWFEMEPDVESPYMLIAARVREQFLLPLAAVPAVTHVDGSARVHTVDADRNGRLHALLTAFFARTGCPMLVNTSFNVRGEPIVCTPADAYRCFQATALDALVIGNAIVRRDSTDEHHHDRSRVEHLAAFPQD